MPELLEIKLYGSNILSQKANEVSEITPELDALIENMIYTMYALDGVGLAAPQVGVSKRIFVCDPDYSKTEKKKPIILINPEFTKYEGEYRVDEGCLSVPGIFEEVIRFQKVFMSYKDIKWNNRTIVAEDTFAVILQHEYDHLEGKTFVEKLNPIKRMGIAFKLNRLIKKAQQMSNDLTILEHD